MSLAEKPARHSTALKREVGMIGLMWASVGSIIGSGWLFGAQEGLVAAGPAAIISWVVGGLMMMVLALWITDAVLVAALVYDTGHAWAEIHPVYGFCVEGGSCYTSGPQFGGTPREGTGNPREQCFTETGKLCRGYEGQVPTYEQVKGESSHPE